MDGGSVDSDCIRSSRDEGYFPVRGLFCKRNGVRGGEVGIAKQIT